MIARIAAPGSPELEIASACELADREAGHFCLVAEASDGGRFAILADVLGNGPMVARAAGYLRARCAAIAPLTSDPSDLLRRANEALVERPPGLRELFSAVCLHYSASRPLLSWALAGHPSPLLVPGLDALDDDGRTVLLGIDSRPNLRTRRRELLAGSGVLAFTAETVDTPRASRRLGQSGLAEIVSRHLDRPAAELVRGAHEAVVDWNAAGDANEACLLVLRRAGAIAD